MVLVVDTFNVLHVTGVLPPEMVVHDVKDLAWLLEQSRYAGTPRLLVCDGPMQGTGHAGPAATKIGAARVVYTGAGREADDEIEALIADSSFPTRLLIASSDRRIIKAARARRATAIRSDAFLSQLVGDLDRQRLEPMPKWVHEIPLAKGSVEHWLETFGIDDETAVALGGRGGEGPRREPTPSADEDQPAAEPDAPLPREAPVPKPPIKPPVDEETRRLAESQGLDPDDLDMGRWLDGG